MSRIGKKWVRGASKRSAPIRRKAAAAAAADTAASEVSSKKMSLGRKILKWAGFAGPAVLATREAIDLATDGNKEDKDGNNKIPGDKGSSALDDTGSGLWNGAKTLMGLGVMIYALKSIFGSSDRETALSGQVAHFRATRAGSWGSPSHLSEQFNDVSAHGGAPSHNLSYDFNNRAAPSYINNTPEYTAGLDR